MNTHKRLLPLVFIAAVTPALMAAQLTQSPDAAAAHSASGKRAMTFSDMMSLKRLGETAVSPDGKWLAYSVTTVNLAKNKKISELWLRMPEGGDPIPVAVAQPGDSGLQFAPDGKHILFVSGREGGDQVWMAEFDAASGATTNAVRLTAIPTEAGDALWSPDGRSVLFTSSVYPDCPAIRSTDFSSGTPGDTKEWGASAGAKCNADRDSAAEANPVKAQVFTHLLYRHWDHFTGAKRSHLFLLDVASGKTRDLTPNDPRDVPPFTLGGGCGCAFSPDSKQLAFTENLDAEPAISTNADIFTLDLTTPDAKPVQVSTAKGGDFTPAYSPDGRFLAWRSQERNSYESDKFRLMLYDFATKTEKDLLPNFDRWVDEFAWSPDSKKVYFVSGFQGYAPIFAIQLDSKTNEGVGFYRFETPEQGFGEYSNLHILSSDDDIIATRMTVQKPGEVIHIHNHVETEHNPGEAVIEIDLVGSKEELQKLATLGEPAQKSWFPVTHLNDALLSQLNLEKMQDFWFTAEDGTRLQGFVISPPGYDAKKKYPTKLLIHGGPQGAWGDSWSYRWNAELLAANGYVVVMINPRGSTGYGQKIVDGVNGDWGGKPFSDLMLGLDEAEKKFTFIDKDRECALGASYGGYMANWVLGHTDRFKCIVSHDGMFNPESAYGSTEELWFNEWEFKGKPWDYYGRPDEENPFRKFSPAMSAKNFRTPTLVIHSQKDFRLDVAEGYQLFTTLQRLGVPSKMLYFPDENHWVLKPQNSQLWYKTVNDWVDQWTK